MKNFTFAVMLMAACFLFQAGIVYAQADVSSADEPADLAMDDEVKPIPDPLEPLNRVFFTFNDRLYFWVLKPSANLYSFFVPEWGRIRVRNVFDNLATPIRFVNLLLQLRPGNAATELSRFVLNSTVGLGGMFDIARRHPELAKSDRDLGQTFGVYGVGSGFYLVIPILGPSSLRDAAGTAGDGFLYPVNYIKDFKAVVAIRAGEEVNDVSLRIGEYEDFKESAIDPYISMRDAYNQHRQEKIKE